MDTHSPRHPRVAPDKIGPDDPRYAYLVRRGYNKRFAGKPDYVRLVGSTEQVVDAVQEAVRDNLRVAEVYYDPEMNAFAVEAGSTLGEVYRKLFLGWGVTIPAGESPDLGVGGHVPGGAFGFLCRQHGLALNPFPELFRRAPSAQRDSILTTSCAAGWMDPQDEPRNLAWVRAFYRDLFADTGGVPVPGGVCDGAMINHPDVDLADPEWNTSGVPWHTLYYKDNYPRLQRIKARWDPRNVFHHALSICP